MTDAATQQVIDDAAQHVKEDPFGEYDDVLGDTPKGGRWGQGDRFRTNSQSGTDEPPTDESPGATWRPADIAATVTGVLDGTITHPTPTVLTRTDGQALMYPGKVNGIAGSSGDGKSLIAQHAATEELHHGQVVIYVDLEDNAASVVSRLLALGADPQAITDRFVYITPDEPYSDAARTLLEGVVADRSPSLVVIDSTGEALSINGAKPNEDDDVARWFRRLPTALARLGPAVVIIDHMPHAADGRLTPIGSQRKLAAIGGAQYITEQVRSFSKDQPGMVKLVCGKDRSGTYRRGQVVAEVNVTPDHGSIRIAVAAPEAGDGQSFRPTHLMERVSRHIEQAGQPLTRNAVRDEVQGNAPAVVKALAVLVDEGYVERTPAGQAHHHAHLKPYREAMG